MKRTPPALGHLTTALDSLRRADRLRSRPIPVDGLSFCSNDYLGLAAEPVTGAGGAGASRMIAGNLGEHERLERTLADWLGTEQALLFASGYAANVGVLSSLIAKDDLVVSDALNHASIIDGIRLARAEAHVVPHLDVSGVANALCAWVASGRPGRAWVVTESYFSMDADTPDLAALRRVCDEHGAALLVDEAHAFGVFGPDGRGLCAAAGVVPDVWIGTFGKAFGASGAFAAGCQTVVDWLWNRARSHVFSTGMSPVVARAAHANFERAKRDPSLRDRAVEHAQTFRAGLSALGADVRGHGPIVPWVLGRESDALRIAAALREHGVHVVAVRPPTVPEGTSRIRFALTARHHAEDVTRALDVLRGIVPCAVV